LGNKEIISIQKKLRPEGKGGLSQREKSLRTGLWKELLSLSFGNANLIQIIGKSDLPTHQPLAYLKENLRHVVLRGKLQGNGVLVLGEFFTKFRNFGKEEYFLEVKEGFPIRIFLPAIGYAFEFFPVVDNKTGEVVGIHRGKVKYEKVLKWEDVTTYTYLDSFGSLFLGGFRPGIDGRRTKGYWARFENHGHEKVRVLVRKGLVWGCTSLEKGWEVPFSLVWDKAEKRYITSFCKGLYQEELDRLSSDHEIHYYFLSGRGVLYLGQRSWMVFGPRYGYYPAWITEILNPSGDKAFIAGAEIREGGRVLAEKRLAQVYEVPPATPERSFAKGKLLEVFENWSPRVERLREKYHDHIITRIFTNGIGQLNVGTLWGTFSRFPRAEVEVKVINGQPAFIKFVADKEGNPILDVKGKPLVLKITPEYKGKLKKQMEARLPKKEAEKIIKALRKEGAKLNWISEETDIEKERISRLGKGEVEGDEYEIRKLKEAFLVFVLRKKGILVKPGRDQNL
jgi:hypothetical protein